MENINFISLPNLHSSGKKVVKELLNICQKFVKNIGAWSCFLLYIAGSIEEPIINVKIKDKEKNKT